MNFHVMKFSIIRIKLLPVIKKEKKGIYYQQCWFLFSNNGSLKSVDHF